MGALSAARRDEFETFRFVGFRVVGGIGDDDANGGGSRGNGGGGDGERRVDDDATDISSRYERELDGEDEMVEGWVTVIRVGGVGGSTGNDEGDVGAVVAGPLNFRLEIAREATPPPLPLPLALALLLLVPVLIPGLLVLAKPWLL